MSGFKPAKVAALITITGISFTLPAAADNQPDKLTQSTSDCGFGEVNDWKAIDDHTLVVWFNNHNDRNARVIELNQACHSLRFTDTIAFKTMDRFRVCSYGGDAVLSGGERCTIGRVRAYDPAKDRTKAELKKDAAKKATTDTPK